MRESEDIGIMLKQINDILGKNANNELRRSNVTISQIRFLSYLLESGKDRVSLKELEKEFQVSQPTVVGIVKRMKDKGLVKTVQSEEDGRAKDVMLSPAGAKILEEGENRKERMEAILLGGLKMKERRELRRMLSTILDSLKKLK